MPLRKPHVLIISVVALAAVGGGVAVGYNALESGRSVSTGTGPSANATGVQGPPLRPAVVRRPDGTVITCPAGAEPTLYIQQATFSPELDQGTRLGRKTYDISLRGSLINETNSPVVVTGLRFEVGTETWAPKISRRGRLGPGESHSFTVHGAFHSARGQQAKVAGHLQWQWQDVKLRPCGAKGLIEDD